MPEKIKKLLLRFNFPKRITVFAVLFLSVLILSITPIQSAQAGVADIIAGALAGIFAGIFGFVFNVIGTITGAILGLIGEVLNWVISPGFISLSYTDPAGNEFIRIGWTLLRDFANILFVIAIIAIGLGTALRIAGYEVKKALPTLIIIALLINFTPVITGLIVDATNIVMNFFLGGVTGFEAFTGILKAQWSGWASGWPDFWKPIGENPMIKAAAGALAIIFFNVFASFILITYIFIFIMRYIAIWALVILSPIAFVAYILPATRNIFSMWWTQFIQWSIIGVVMAFFLYLANHLIAMILLGITDPENPEAISLSASTGEFSGLLNQLLPWGIVIVFLFLGLMIGLSTSAMGANFAKSMGASMPGRIAKTSVGRKTLSKLAGGTEKSLAAVSPALRRLEDKAGRVPVVGKVLKPATAVITRPFGWTTRGAGTIIGPRLLEYAAGARRVDKPKNWDKMSIGEKERFVNAKTTDSDRLVLGSEMKGEGTLQKSSPEFRKKMLEAADKFKGDSNYTKEVGDIFDAFPDKITRKMKIELEVAPLSQADKKEKRESLEKEIEKIRTEYGLEDSEAGRDKAASVMHIQKLKPKDISEISKKSLDSDSFRMATWKMSSSHMQTLRNSFDNETVKTVLEGEKGLNTIKGTDKGQIGVIRRDNPDLIRWAYHSPAGRETLNWSEEWGPEEKLPPKAGPSKPKIVMPGTEEFKETEERIKKGTLKDTGEAGAKKRKDPDVGER